VTEQTYVLSAGAAEFYESTFVPALFGEWAGRLVDFAAPAPGQRVLDVACGTGVVARAAAARVGGSAVAGSAVDGSRVEGSRVDGSGVGGGGAVVGVDINDAMLAVARRLRPELTWLHGDAGALPFDDGCFDVVLCQGALMFFPDRVAALREMGRVAGPGGLVAVQVPGRLANSAGYLALTEVAARHGGPQVLDLLAAYFAVGEPDLLAGLHAAAGLHIDRFETWQGATRLDSIETFLSVELLPLAGAVDDEVRRRIAADCRPALAGFVDATGAVAAPIEVHLIAAHVAAP
jgi:SAM-dependent methyltransferase